MNSPISGDTYPVIFCGMDTTGNAWAFAAPYLKGGGHYCIDSSGQTRQIAEILSPPNHTSIIDSATMKCL